jgi:fucose permease
MLNREGINRFNLVTGDSFTLVSISLCKFLYAFYTLAIGPLLVHIGESFDIGLRIQSIVFPFNYFGQIVIVFFVGLIADKLGKKVIHILFVVLLALSALIFTFINSYVFFLFLFLFMGLFGISINIIADASISDMFTERRGLYLNLAHAFFGLGAICSPIVYNLALSITGDFRTIYFVLFLLSFAVLILITLTRYPNVSDEIVKMGVIAELIKNRKFMLLALYAAVSWGTLFAISSWIPTLFTKELEMPSRLSNYSLAYMWTAVIIGRVIAALLSKKYSEIAMVKVINLAVFILIALSFFLDNPVFLLADYLFLGLLMGTFAPLTISYSAEVYKLHSTTRLAVIFAMGSVGMLVIPTLIGLFGENMGIHRVIALTSILFLAYIFVFRRRFLVGGK